MVSVMPPFGGGFGVTPQTELYGVGPPHVDLNCWVPNMQVGWAPSGASRRFQPYGLPSHNQRSGLKGVRTSVKAKSWRTTDMSKGDGGPPRVRKSTSIHTTHLISSLFVDCSMEYDFSKHPTLPNLEERVLQIHPDWLLKQKALPRQIKRPAPQPRPWINPGLEPSWYLHQPDPKREPQQQHRGSMQMRHQESSFKAEALGVCQSTSCCHIHNSYQSGRWWNWAGMPPHHQPQFYPLPPPYQAYHHSHWLANPATSRSNSNNNINFKTKDVTAVI